MSDYKILIRNRVRGMLEKSDLKPSQLANAAGVAPSTLTRFLNGDTKHDLSGKTLYKLEGYLRSIGQLQEQAVSTSAVAEAVEPFPPSDIPARLQIARLCYWDTQAEAASELSIPSDLLQQYEQGIRQIPADFIYRFSKETGCPMGWLMEGSLEGIETRLAIWIGYRASNLVPGIVRRKEPGGPEGVGEA